MRYWKPMWINIVMRLAHHVSRSTMLEEKGRWNVKYIS